MAVASYISVAGMILAGIIALYRLIFRYSIKHIRGPLGSFLRGEYLVQVSI